LLPQVKSIAFSSALPLVVIPFLFFWAGAGFVASADLPGGKLHFIGFCLVFVLSRMSLTSEVCHFEFPPGISEASAPAGVAMQHAATL
jgi:hypothetical protein